MDTIAAKLALACVILGTVGGVMALTRQHTQPHMLPATSVMGAPADPCAMASQFDGDRAVDRKRAEDLRNSLSCGQPSRQRSPA